MRICSKCGVRYMRDEPFCNQDGAETQHVTEVFQDPESLVGATLGSYHVEKLLGVGGMGKVYRAEHTLLGRKVAVKILNAEFSVRPSLVQRFFNEARAVNQIEHENIIEITDYGTTPDGTSYFVMELLRGGKSLEHVVRETPVMDEKRAIHIAVQIADALAAAHEEGIIHRDLKPANVHLIRRSHTDDFVKLLDFGIAKLIDDEAGVTTKTGMIIGTPTYMSPEQARGQGVDERSDIYSFGVILYRMLSGVLPFKADSFPAMLRMHLREPPKPIGEVNPNISLRFQALVMCCLEKRAEDRYQDMAEIAREMRELGGLPSRFEATSRDKTAEEVDEDSPTIARDSGADGISQEPTTLRSAAGEVGGASRTRWSLIAAVAVVMLSAAGATSFILLRANNGAADATAEVEEPEARLVSEPPGAVVMEDDEELGNTPLTLRTDRKRKLTLRLDGFVEATVVLAEGSTDKESVTLERAETAIGEDESSDAAAVLDVDETLDDPVALEILERAARSGLPKPEGRPKPGAKGTPGEKRPPVKKPTPAAPVAKPEPEPETAAPVRESPFKLHE